MGVAAPVPALAAARPPTRGALGTAAPAPPSAPPPGRRWSGCGPGPRPGRLQHCGHIHRLNQYSTAKVKRWNIIMMTGLVRDLEI